jgi:hypothetical protein
MINLGMREALINNECEKKTAYLKKASLKPMRLNPGPLFHPLGQGALPEILKEIFSSSCVESSYFRNLETYY